MKRSASADSLPSPKRAKNEIRYAVDKDGLIGSLSTNHHLICYLYQNRSDLIVSLPSYAGIRNVKILDQRYLYGLCTTGMGKPYLYRYLDTTTKTTFILDESKLEDYAKEVKLNKWLALATHPLVLQYILIVKPKDISIVYTAKDRMRSFTSDGVTINIIIAEGTEFKQLN